MSKRLRVLIIDDSEDDTLLLLRGLSQGGFEPQFLRVDSPEAMTSALASQSWDIIISDYSMPYFSGLAALNILKQSGLDLPFILVSGTIGEDLAVEAMKAGAHDYVMKNSLQRLGSAIERELKEAEVRREHRLAEMKVKRNAERIQALHEIDLAISSTLDLQAVLNILLEKIDPVIPFAATTVRLFNKGTGVLEPAACRNINEKEWKAIRRNGLHGVVSIVLENKIPLTVSNIQTDPRSVISDFARKEGLVSYLGVPLVAKDEVLGLIGFYTRKPYSFSDDEIGFLTTLAGQAAIAIHNATLYEQVKKQMVELEKANKVKDEFLGVISHELRTPLNVSMGYTALVKDGSLGEINADQEKALEKVMSQTKDLLKMIDEILCVRSLEANAVEVSSGEMSVGELLEELKADYSISLDKDIRLVCDYSANLPVIKTDSPKLKHILQNLLNNAIKFTKRGHVALEARYIQHANAVQFSVSDSGVGIPKEKLSIIFEMFRQADSSKTRPYEGVGIGLFIVKKFTDLLGGEIAVESEIDEGSTFTVTIPAKITGSRQPRTEDYRNRPLQEA